MYSLHSFCISRNSNFRHFVFDIYNVIIKNNDYIKFNAASGFVENYLCVYDIIVIVVTLKK